MSNEGFEAQITKLTDALAKPPRRKLSDPTLTTRELIEAITDRLTVPAGLALGLSTGDIQNATTGMVVVQAAGKSVAYMTDKFDSLADGLDRYKPKYQYSTLYQDVKEVANTDPAYNKAATFSIGRIGLDGQKEEWQSASVQLESGYDVDVNMYAGDENPMKRFRPISNASSRRAFKVADRETFRESNRHMSGDREERIAHHGDSDFNHAFYELTTARDHEQLVEQLMRHQDDPDVYVDVVGAPYHYKEDDNKFYPSTVRYQGESLKELAKIADLSAKEPNIGKGSDYQVDMVDLAYAHGKHSQEVRVSGSRLTRPEYQIDTQHPELFSNKNHKHNLTSLVRNVAKGIKRTYSAAKEKGTALYQRLRGPVETANAQLNDVLTSVSALETDGAAPALRPTPEAAVESAYHTSSNDAQYIEEAAELSLPEEQVYVDMDTSTVIEPEAVVVEEVHAVPVQPTPQQTEAQRIVALNAQHARRSLQGRLAAQLDTARTYDRSGPEQ